MGLIILLAVLLVLSIIFYQWFEDRNANMLPVLVGAFSGVILGVCLIYTMTLKADFNKIEYEYNMNKETISYMRENQSTYETMHLHQAIFEMNNKIAKHKAYHNNFWIGIYFSKRIDLEPLK